MFWKKLKNLFKSGDAVTPGAKKSTKVKVKEGEEAEEDVVHVRAGDFCNTCDCHVDECEYFRGKN